MIQRRLERPSFEPPAAGSSPRTSRPGAGLEADAESWPADQLMASGQRHALRNEVWAGAPLFDRALPAGAVCGRGRLRVTAQPPAGLVVTR